MRYRTFSPAIAIAALSILSQPAAAHAPELHQQNQQNQTSSSPSPSPSKPSPFPENTCKQPPCDSVSPNPSNQKTKDDPPNELQEPSTQPSIEPSTKSQPTSNQQMAKSPIAGWGETIFAAIIGVPCLLYLLKYRVF